jgi:uncharacterized hydrophobic protein (TIGR00271 family)
MNPIQVVRKVMHYLELQSELDDFEVIHTNFVKDSIFKGTNLWILMFAIIIASVGLNVNSTAVIIGAMLISPLMGPINGMGYSLATYDFDLFRRALKNFSFAVGVSLFASTAYFALSPLSNAHSELFARTSPTIYDVIIAMVGGLSGIVAISSRQKGNVIPGVAIATALMPPLCTAGYGIATLQLNFFLGALYLFTINTVFIAMSAVAMSQILKFPIRSFVEPAQKKRINRWITAVILIVMLPSVYFGYGLVLKEKFADSAKSYVASVNFHEGSFLLTHDINPNTSTITLVYGGEEMNEYKKAYVRQAANEYGLKTTTIEIIEGLSNLSMELKNSEVFTLKEELGKMHTALNLKQTQLDSIVEINHQGKELLEELNALYPEISSCSFAKSTQYNRKDSVPTTLPVIIMQLNKKIQNSEKEKIDNWLMARLKAKNIRTFYESTKD